jgi:hypothetical protein
MGVMWSEDRISWRVASRSSDDVQDLGVGSSSYSRSSSIMSVRGQKRQGGDLRPFETREQVILAEAGDGGDEDEHLGQHHEDDRQDQEAS